MIIKEELKIKNRDFVRQYSDNGVLIERDGVQYGEAIDPIEFGREYTETDIEVEE